MDEAADHGYDCERGIGRGGVAAIVSVLAIGEGKGVAVGAGAQA